MKRTVILPAAVVLLAGATCTVVAADGGPLAEAGLDQEVGVNTTVHLDGTGSSHPNGTIKGYEWSIETPDGRTITPACSDCNRTRFTPHETGRYDVTVTVTDEHGRTDRDTLYVFVEEAGPTVELDGDTEPPVGEATTYNATARTTNADLRHLTWKLGNRTVARESLSGSQDSSRRDVSFGETGTYRLVVIVRDSSNRTGRDSLILEPRADDTEIEDVSAPDGNGEDRNGCTAAGVVANPAGNGTAAAVFCASGQGQNINHEYADEVCSTEVKNCEYATVDGDGGARGNGGGDNGGGGYSRIRIADSGGSRGESQKSTEGVNIGGVV